jgi:hypothetical protein
VGVAEIQKGSLSGESIEFQEYLMWEERRQSPPSEGFNPDQMWQIGQDWLAILLGVMLFGGIAGGWWAIILTVMRLI